MCFKCMGHLWFDEPGAAEHGSSDFKGYQEILKMALKTFISGFFFFKSSHDSGPHLSI